MRVSCSEAKRLMWMVQLKRKSLSHCYMRGKHACRQDHHNLGNLKVTLSCYSVGYQKENTSLLSHNMKGCIESSNNGVNLSKNHRESLIYILHSPPSSPTLLFLLPLSLHLWLLYFHLGDPCLHFHHWELFSLFLLQ